MVRRVGGCCGRGCVERDSKAGSWGSFRLTVAEFGEIKFCGRWKFQLRVAGVLVRVPPGGGCRGLAGGCVWEGVNDQSELVAVG